MVTKDKWLWVDTPHGNVRVYNVEPASSPPWPSLLMLHSVMGLDPYIQELAANFAEDGYWAVVPDLYSNDGGYKNHRLEDIEIAAHMGGAEAQQEHGLSGPRHSAILSAREWIGHRPTHTYIDLVQPVFNYLDGHADARGVGALGFCMGGRLVGELVERGVDLSAGVVHYGRPPNVDLVKNIRGPIEGHYASRDTGITGKVPVFAAAMESAGKEFNYYIYKADHGFSLAPHLPSHDKEAARVSLARSKLFLSKHLRPTVSSKTTNLGTVPL